MSSALVISSYPLSGEFRSRAALTAGRDAEFVTVADIRAKGVARWLRRSWGARPRPVYIAIESESSRALLPALAVLATALHGAPIRVIDPDASVRRIRMPQVGFGCMRLAAASVDGMIARARIRLDPHGDAASSRQASVSLGDGWRGAKVLYVKNTLSTGVRAGGSVGHVAGVVNALDDAGAVVKMITTEPSPMVRRSVEEMHPRGMEVFGLPSQANVFRMQRQTIRRALELSKSWRPDLIYQRLTLGDASGAHLSRMLGVPLVTEYNGSEVWCNRNWGAGVRYAAEFVHAEERMLRASNLVFTISKVLLEELHDRGLPDRVTGWYPNGIDPSVYDPARFPHEAVREVRDRLGFEETDFVVTFVGTFGDWHGSEVLARAIGQAAEPKGRPMRFLFVGDGKNRAQTEAIIAEAGAESRCRFVGLIPQERTPLYLAASDCFASPHVPNPDGTEFFGSPTKLFEYMSMARPIIASRLGQIAEVLSHRRTALLVEPGDPAGLAGAVLEIANNRELAARLGQAARSEALARFTWARHVEEIRRCFERARGCDPVLSLLR